MQYIVVVQNDCANKLSYKIAVDSHPAFAFLFKAFTALFCAALLSTPAAANPVPLSGISQLNSGYYHNCAINNDSKVFCWGKNTDGQLGDGTRINRPLPTAVLGLPPNITAIATGTWHSCALTSTGDMWCWGKNTQGQLGINSKVDQLTPVQVIGFTEVQKMYAGDQHTCAIKTDGQLFCWGNNDYGHLGDGTSTERLVPTAVINLTEPVSEVSAGNSHTCAISNTGILKCWGRNLFGQLGDGTTTTRQTPTTVSGGLIVSTISTSFGHSCASTSNGEVWCWGFNGFGRLGNNSEINSLIPVQVVGISTATQVSVGEGFSCARLQDSTLACWGGNYTGALGNTTLINSSLPVASVVSDVASVSTGHTHACALLNSGGVLCWGSNTDEKLGDGSANFVSAVHPVAGLPNNGTTLSLGDNQSCLVSDTGALRCWGSNKHGELGEGSYIQRLLPELVLDSSFGVVQHAAGESHSCVLAPQAAKVKVFCSGSNQYGQLGDGSVIASNSFKPALIPTVEALAISNGGVHSCMVDDVGKLACSGINEHGQACNTNLSSDVLGFESCPATSETFVSVESGSAFNCALSSLGEVWCWGVNFDGELGIGNNTKTAIPTKVSGLNGITISKLSLGKNHACAVSDAGSTYCWGNNSSGQLGNNTTLDSNVPLAVATLTGITSDIAAGNEFSCAKLSSGSVQCWGKNSSAQLGDGTTTNRLIPTQVIGLTSNIASIALGDSHTCILRNNGAVGCWGKNLYGQIGNGFAENRAWPSTVLFQLPEEMFANGFETATP